MNEDELEKAREEKRIARQIKEDSEKPLLVVVNGYMEGWRGTDENTTKKPLESFIKSFESYFERWVCCEMLAGYLHFLKHPVEELVKGYVKKEDDIIEHLWIQMADIERNIIDPFAAFINNPDIGMPQVYVGKKPAWYEAVEDEKDGGKEA